MEGQATLSGTLSSEKHKCLVLMVNASGSPSKRGKALKRGGRSSSPRPRTPGRNPSPHGPPRQDAVSTINCVPSASVDKSRGKDERRGGATRVRGASPFHAKTANDASENSSFKQNRSQPSTSRSMATTASSASSTRSQCYWPPPNPIADLHSGALFANITFHALEGDNWRQAKESSWIVQQAFHDSLRCYPHGQSMAQDGGKSKFDPRYTSGNTPSANRVVKEHLDTEVRARLGIKQAPDEWAPDQCQYRWGDEGSNRRRWQMSQN